MMGRPEYRLRVLAGFFLVENLKVQSSRLKRQAIIHCQFSILLEALSPRGVGEVSSSSPHRAFYSALNRYTSF